MVKKKTAAPPKFHLDPHADAIADNLADGDPDELLRSGYVAAKLHVTTDSLLQWRKNKYGHHINLSVRV
jgi:hypothetical protein